MKIAIAFQDPDGLLITGSKVEFENASSALVPLPGDIVVTAGYRGVLSE